LCFVFKKEIKMTYEILIGRYSVNDEAYWATGDSVEDILANLQDLSGEEVDLYEVAWFQAGRVFVEESRSYTITPM
jgi:hypothetical protein